MLIFSARGLIQTFIKRSDELGLLFECAMFWSALRSRSPTRFGTSELSRHLWESEDPAVNQLDYVP